jgi:hypothetical protein
LLAIGFHREIERQPVEGHLPVTLVGLHEVGGVEDQIPLAGVEVVGVVPQRGAAVAVLDEVLG